MQRSCRSWLIAVVVATLALVRVDSIPSRFAARGGICRAPANSSYTAFVHAARIPLRPSVVLERAPARIHHTTCDGTRSSALFAEAPLGYGTIEVIEQSERRARQVLGQRLLHLSHVLELVHGGLGSGFLVIRRRCRLHPGSSLLRGLNVPTLLGTLGGSVLWLHHRPLVSAGDGRHRSRGCERRRNWRCARGKVIVRCLRLRKTYLWNLNLPLPDVG